jgi:hypothetical protein
MSGFLAGISGSGLLGSLGIGALLRRLIVGDEWLFRTDASFLVTDRMRSYRRRRGRGLRCIRVHVGRPELDDLVAKGCLLPADREDVAAIKLAISDLMFDWLRRA